MASWVLHLLGDEQISRMGRGPLSLPDIWWPVLGSLLAAPGRSLSRGAMAGRLWPDKDEDAARHCLATALWRIRSRLPSGQRLLRVDGDSVRLALGRFDFVDVLLLDRRARVALREPQRLQLGRERRRLARALGLYRGAYLQEREQEPIAFERERLRTLYLDALFLLAEAERAAGNWQAARAAAQSLCAVEPLREDAQRLLMTAHVRCGSRALALSQYKKLEQLLASELDIAPMAETRTLAARIGAGEAAAEAPEASSDPARESMLRVRRRLESSIRIIDAVLG
ncbi:MAG: hypothetical protein JO013_00705 [Alphaproteobacteria bacterium]|nr:hypothetical protein [Alphaproteobacteria bacterium]